MTTISAAEAARQWHLDKGVLLDGDGADLQVGEKGKEEVSD